MSEHADEDLLIAGGRGDRPAFGELVERHHRMVVQFVYRFLGDVDRSTAEDLAQDVFLHAWEAAPSFRARAKVVTWLLRIAKNRSLNYRRGQRLRRMASLDRGEPIVKSVVSSAPVEAAAVAREEAEGLHRAVAELPPKQRAAIILRHFHDLAYSDVADVLEVSVSAVESLLFRARTTLRGVLAPARKSADSPQVSPGLGAESLREGTVT